MYCVFLNNNLFLLYLIIQDLESHLHQKLLLNHTWPGNIFEIMNLSENIIGLLTANNLFVSKNLIEDLMNNSIDSTDLYDLNFREAKDKFEKD